MGLAHHKQMDSHVLRVCLCAIITILIVSLASYVSAQSTAAGTITTYAGFGLAYQCAAFHTPPDCPQIGGYGFNGDGGAATAALLDFPGGITIDAAGDLFIADSANHRIREVTPDGIISTIAGNGRMGFGGDGGPATSAELNSPEAVAVDAAGNLFIADWGNNRIREVTPPGIIYTIAGNGTQGYSGDGGPATSATLSHVLGVAVNAVGDIFIADTGNSAIRMVAPNGVISTAAGNGTFGFSGDGGPATSAVLNRPYSIATDAAGNLFIPDSGNNRIRKVTSAGVITTVAVGLNTPAALAVDVAGNIFVADFGSNSVRKVSPGGAIFVVAGNGTLGPPSGDGGPATSAVLIPTGVALDAAGDLFINESQNSRVREVTAVAAAGVPTTTSASPAAAAFSIPNGAGVSLTSSGTSQAGEDAGYAEVLPNSGGTAPAGLAIFGFRETGVLISEAGVPASQLLQSGRIFAEMNGAVNTGIALVNPNNQSARVSFYFTDSAGNNSPAGVTVIPGNGKIAAFLTEPPFDGASSFTGSFTFNSLLPIAAVALRGLVNQRSEFLMTTIPVTDLSASSASGPGIFPQFAEGGGWTTELALVNPGDTTLKGSVVFYGPDGPPNINAVTGSPNNFFDYSIPPRAAQRFQGFQNQTHGNPASVTTGTMRVSPDPGTPAIPSGVAIFSFVNNGVTETEASVPSSQAGTVFRLYVEAAGSFTAAGSIQPGLAIASVSPSSADPGIFTTVTLTLNNLDGSPTGLTGTVSLPPNGQVAKFLYQFPGFASLPSTFKGVLSISSTSAISVIGLRGRYNERRDFLITTTPPVNQAAAPSTAPLFFPHIVDSGGYTTQFILFSAGPGQSPSGSIELFSASGGPLNIIL